MTAVEPRRVEAPTPEFDHEEERPGGDVEYVEQFIPWLADFEAPCGCIGRCAHSG